jgi:DNA polymerase III subunit alpha
MSFVHLHTHSHYSLLDGLGKIDDLISRAVDYNMPALALTDHGVMYGAVEFFQKCKKAGIKPIIGVEAYVSRTDHLDRSSRISNKPYHLILLAKNEEGYRNIVKLTTIAHLEGFYYKPRIDWELLQKHSEGVVCLTACLAGELSVHIINDNMDAARDMIARYQKLFGKDSFFLEVQSHPNLQYQELVNKKIFELSKETGAQVVATNDIHYPDKDDAHAQDILLCIQTKKTLADKDRMSLMDMDLCFKTTEEMGQAFPDHPEVITNTLKVMELCNFEMKLGETILPNFPLPEGKTADQQLRTWCEEGFKKRYKDEKLGEVMSERLEYELGIILKTGYAGYFLIVADFINWAKDSGIIVGPGRGSAAGSFVSYLIGITNIDPIEYDLVFERFLNPERISMPDIDTDFADIRRDDVLKYATEKYGKDRVAQIITFGTMAARASIRDVGRVMSLPYSYCDTAAKLVPMFTKLKDAIDTVPELKALMQEEDGKKLLETAQRLEGVVRHASTHACGVVITPMSMDNYGPRQYGSNESIIIQYDGHAVDDLGLLKMDFLGLSNLTIVERALEIIDKIHGVKIDIENIPLDDDKTFKLFQAAKTTGVFQMESGGIKRNLKLLKPTDLEDIIAMVALYRPGPMEYIPDYIDGKHGKKEPNYLHPKLKPILGKTYGVAVYQEQLLQIARDLAGFSYGEADILRKAVGKKIKELLDQQEVKMIDGMVNNGVSKDVAKKIWEFILPFASYGFNRSHAACYALIAYQTAYLKANYPAEFMAALLTSDQGNSDRIAIEVEECRNMGIDVLPPDINESFSTFTVVADSLKEGRSRIRFGLMAVKGLGENIVKTIIAERRENGPYKNLEDFLRRVQTKDLNKRSLDALIKSGSMDVFAERGCLLHNMEMMLVFIAECSAVRISNQNSLFDGMPQEILESLRLKETDPLVKKQKLAWEKEYLNLYVSEHPLEEFRSKIQNVVVRFKDLKNHTSKGKVRIAGVVSSIKKIFTKKGDPMLFVKVEDETGSAEVLVFPKILEQNPNLWQMENIIICSGEVSDKDDEPKLLCDQAAILTHNDLRATINRLLLTSTGGGRKNFYKKKEPVAPKPENKVMIRLDYPLDYELSQKINNIFFDYPGNHGVELSVNNPDGDGVIFSTNFRINSSEEFIKSITDLIGAQRVEIK